MFGCCGLVLAPQVVVLLGLPVGLLFASSLVWFASFVIVRFTTLICVDYDFFGFAVVYCY